MPRVVNAQGARFLVDTTDFIDQCIAWEGMWDGPQLDRLAAVSLAAQPAGYFVDVGANSGLYSVMFATRNLANRIVAFEPDPGNYARLLSNLTLNGLCHRVDARRLALGDAEGDVTLYEGAMWNKGESSIALPDQTPKVVTHLVQQARFDNPFALSDEGLGRVPVAELLRRILPGVLTRLGGGQLSSDPRHSSLQCRPEFRQRQVVGGLPDVDGM